MTLEKFLKFQMLQNDIPDKTELARQTGIDYQRLNRRIKAPSSLTLSEIAALCSVLNFSEDTLMEFLRLAGALWGENKIRRRTK